MKRRTEYLKKGLLLTAIAVTAAVPLLFVDYDEPTTALTIMKALAKTGSLAGTVLVLWQFLLGFRGISSLLMRDILWGYIVHKIVGIGAVGLILLHPVFITVYYLQRFDNNTWTLRITEWFSTMVLFGLISYVIMVVVVLSSTLWRQKLSKRWWYRIHLTAYAALVLALVHGLAIGMTLRGTALRYVWFGLIAILVGFTVVRLAWAFGHWCGRYKVSSVKKVAQRTTEIIVEPRDGIIEPGIGQFVYVRKGRYGSARPYTAAHYDPKSKRLGVTIKALGTTSQQMQHVEPGQEIYVDGPYGVFLDAVFATDKPLVMVAGGIGITPFLRLIERLERQKGRQGWFFYGNKRADDIAYREEIDNCRHVQVVHVISDDPDFAGEKGFITPDVMKKYLPGEFGDYEYLLCGPAVMTMKLKDALARTNVPRSQVHYEIFSL